jgi:hypothetical protein
MQPLRITATVLVAEDILFIFELIEALRYDFLDMTTVKCC